MPDSETYPCKVKLFVHKNKHMSARILGTQINKYCLDHDLVRFVDYDWGVDSHQMLWFVFTEKHRQLANMLLWKYA